MGTDGTQSGRASKALTGAVLAAGLLAGCGIWRPPPDVRQAWNPEALAPPAVGRSWEPPAPAETYQAPAGAWRDRGPEPPPSDATLDLPDMVDLALRANPETRATWEAARAAAARYGRSMREYFPVVSTEAYATPLHRFYEETNKGTFIVRESAIQPSLVLTFTLLDFGRRAQSAERARQQLVAANFAFNRRLQQVVFDVQRAYYGLDAAQGLERAATRNVELAVTVRAATEHHMTVGLATQPEVLLARQVETRAIYDLENARVAVKDAEATLAVAIGIPARQFWIESLVDQPPPAAVGEAVDVLIDSALARRPDLAGRVAELRAADAAVARAKADFLPIVGFRGQYGEAMLHYNTGGPNFRTNAPTYFAGFTVNWDLFKGFDRLNAVREAEADSRGARAALAASELDVIAEVWRAYYDYKAAVRKLEFAEALLQASQEAYDANLKTYEVGLSDIVELLTAERDLANARYTLVQSRAELLTTAARVVYAAGAITPGQAEVWGGS